MSLFASFLMSSSAPVSASMSPTVVSGSRRGAGVCTTGVATVTPSGGVPPYTYSWAYVSGDTGFTANTGTSSSTSFNITLNLTDFKHAVWSCTVTDSASQTASVNVSMTAKETSYL